MTVMLEKKWRRIYLSYQPGEGPHWQAQDKKSVHLSEKTTGAGKTCLLQGPKYSSEECKVLKYYSKEYAAQRPHKENEAHSFVKTKHNKSFKFNSNVKEYNFMEHGYPIPKKKKRGN